MASRHLSLRLEVATFEKLDAESRRSGQSRSQVAKTLLEEGLRMEAHPGIIFRSGPAGRRPGLTDGPDVWEVARIFRDMDVRSEDTIGRVTDLIDLSRDQVRVALSYYADYPREIDEWIQRVDDEAARMEDAWLRQQALLRR